MKRDFRGAPRPLLPDMLLVATNPNAGQEHDVVAPSQPSSSTPTPIHASIPSPTPIPETKPEPFEHIFEEPSPPGNGSQTNQADNGECYCEVGQEGKEAGKQEKNQMGLLTMDDGIVNWGEHTENEETNHVLMSISSNSEANEIYEKDEKLKKYRRIGMKAVKEKEQLHKTLDSWKDSFKNLWRLINSGMSSNSKIGLEEDSVGKPLYSSVNFNTG
ncbi:hypothetical protein Tco_1580006, partial [Tanacetum coccineum]